MAGLDLNQISSWISMKTSRKGKGSKHSYFLYCMHKHTFTYTHILTHVHIHIHGIPSVLPALPHTVNDFPTQPGSHRVDAVFSLGCGYFYFSSREGKKTQHASEKQKGRGKIKKVPQPKASSGFLSLSLLTTNWAMNNL
jgi:hypothetical protein